MNPKILVVLGAAGFMCFLFVIVGVISWVNSQDDDGDDDDDDDNDNDNDNGDDDEEDGVVCGEECQASLAIAAAAGGRAPGETTCTSQGCSGQVVSIELPASDGNKGTQTLEQANAAATAVGMTLESTAQSMWCSPGYVAMDGVCYPICDNYVYEDGEPGTPENDVRKLFKAKGLGGGADSACGTTDSGSGKTDREWATDWNTDDDEEPESWYDHIQKVQTAQFGRCDQTFSIDKSPNAPTGYVICHPAGGRCRASYSPTSTPKIECIPKNVHPDKNTGKKAPECSGFWNYGKNPSGTSGANTWKSASDEGGCLCYNGTTEIYPVHDGHGNDWAKGTWKCKSNRPA